MSTRQIFVFFVLLFAALTAWGGLYIYRTSFAFEDTRVFTLWDDAMISMRYARHLRLGRGLVWNAGGDAVQGFSNPGVTLVMTALHGLPGGPYQASLHFQLLCLVLLAAVWGLVWRVARRWWPDEPWVAACATVATALCAPLSIWSVQGSDVAFVCLWLLACVWLVEPPLREGRPWPARVFWVVALGIAIRPDVSVFAVVFLLVAVLSPADRLRHFALGGAAVATAWAGLLTFGELYYGDPLPNTFHLKARGAPIATMWASGLSQLARWLPHPLPALGLAGAALGLARSDRRLWLGAALTVAAFAYHVAVGGDWLSHYGSRFIVPVLPLLLILATAGGRALVDRFLPPPWRRSWKGRASLAATVVGAVLFLNPAGTAREWFDPSVSTMLKKHHVRNFRVAHYFRDHTVPLTSVAVHWAGVIPYFSERPAIDVLGRSDRHIARVSVQREKFKPSHSKWDWDYVLERKPDVFDGASRGLRERSDFQRDYYIVKAPGVGGFYVRKESLHKLTDRQVVLEDMQTGESFPRSELAGHDDR